jgi:hypothetical protein
MAINFSHMAMEYKQYSFYAGTQKVTVRQSTTEVSLA